MKTSLRQTDTYREVLAWLRGGDATPDEEMEGRFIDIVAQLVAEKIQNSEQRSHRRRADLQPAPLSIKYIMREITGMPELDGTAAENAKTHTDAPAERISGKTASHTELDSLMLAKALRHMALIEGIQLTMSQIQCILYIAYGVRLAQKGERLMAEHPRMWQYGPVFPRAYNRLRKDTDDGFEEYDSLRSEHPVIFRYLTNCFRRYAWTKACILVSPLIADGSPWSDTRKSNPDSWGARIEDSLIREWFLPRV